MEAFLPSYLELSLATFAQQQERMRTQFTQMGQATPLGAYDDQIRQNLAMFDRAMKMFTPFAYTPKPEDAAPRSETSASGEGGGQTDMLKTLQEQMAAMQAQINKLASKD